MLTDRQTDRQTDTHTQRQTHRHTDRHRHTHTHTICWLFARLALLLAVEVPWNIYPSTVWSSALLHVCHAALLIGVFWTAIPEAKKVKTK